MERKYRFWLLREVPAYMRFIFAVWSRQQRQFVWSNFVKEHVYGIRSGWKNVKMISYEFQGVQLTAPKMEMCLFGMEPSYFQIATFDGHYFFLAKQPVCLSEQMRSAHTDKRGFPVFIWWENIHIDALLSAALTRWWYRRLHRLGTEGPRHQHNSGSDEELTGWRETRRPTAPRTTWWMFKVLLECVWRRVKKEETKCIWLCALCLWTSILQWAHQRDGSYSALTATPPPPHYKHITLFIRSMLQSVPQTKALAWMRIWSLGATWSLHTAPQGWAEWEQAPLWLCVETFSHIWVHVHQMRWKSLSRECGTETRSPLYLSSSLKTTHQIVAEELSGAERLRLKAFQTRKCTGCFMAVVHVQCQEVMWFDWKHTVTWACNGLWALKPIFVFSVWQGTKSTVELSVKSDGILHKRAVSAWGWQAIISVTVCCDVF